MDATELNELLEDFRDTLHLVKTGDDKEVYHLQTITEVAAENKVAYKAIGHICEDHLLKVRGIVYMACARMRSTPTDRQARGDVQADSSTKIGTLLVIDSICQRAGEPYPTYFSSNIGRMYREVWNCSAPGSQVRARLKRWVAHHKKTQLFTPAALQAMEAATSEGAVPDQQPAGKVDPRRARAANAPAAQLATPMPAQHQQAHAQPAQAMRPPPPMYNSAYGAPPVPQAPQWHAQQPAGMHGHAHNAQRGPGSVPPDPLAQYRAAQQAHAGGLPPLQAHGAYGGPVPPRGPPQAKPLGTAFRGVRLQDPRPESLLFLNEATRKIRTYLNDKRIARERQRRAGKAPSARRWYAPAEMWVRGAVAVDTAAPEQADAAAEAATQAAKAEDVRLTVIKDDSQPECAISHEAFAEEWDEEQQEWVYTDAVRLPPDIARLPGVNVEPGSIVKAGLLDAQTLQLLREHIAAQSKASKQQRQGVKRNLPGQGAASDAAAPLAQLAKLAQGGAGVKQEASAAVA